MPRIRSTASATKSKALSPGARPPLAGPLLAWFSRARRDLPWRREPRDPYRVWVSEVMLQQTRVDVVVPYFERFVRRFPTLRALAEAPLDDVLAHFGGLGYYARARNLHKAAQAAQRDHGGALPRTSAGLATLPGFGPYTAAAVASLAFGEQVALVDGNVARVLARALRLPGDAAQVKEIAWGHATALLPLGRAGAFNEALMELGATVCTPRSPGCGVCPIAGLCASRPHGDAESYPAPKARKVRPQVTWAAVALRRADGAVLLARRPPGTLFEGMWDLPSTELPPLSARAQRAFVFGAEERLDSAPEDSAAAPAARAALLLLLARSHRAAELVTSLSLTRAGAVAQTLTHRELRVVVYGALLPAGRRAQAAFPDGADLRWTAPDADALRTLGLSSLARKALRAAGIP